MRNKKREIQVDIVDTVGYVGYKSNILPYSYYSFLTELEYFFSEPSTHPIHNQMLQKMQALYTYL